MALFRREPEPRISEEELITMASRQAARYARTGPKADEDLCHTVINHLLDHIDKRKEK